MKKILFFCLISALALVSCSKDDDELPHNSPSGQGVDKPVVENVRYYVRYEVKFQTQHLNAPRFIKYTNENGTQTISLSDDAKTVTWDRTYGPVDKNFVALLDCNVGSYEYTSNIHAKISMSRDKEPFVTKAEGSGTKSVSIQYKVDF